MYLPGGSVLMRGGKAVLNAADCCCEQTCEDCVGTPCGSCPGITPDAVSVLFGGVRGTPRCSYNTAAPYEVFKLVLSLSGVSITCAQTAGDPCVYEANMSAGLAQIQKCFGDGTGCAACDGGANVVTAGKLRIRYGGSPIPELSLLLTVNDPNFGGVSTLTVIGIVSTFSEPPDKCCDSTTVQYRSSSGFEDVLLTIVDGGYTVTPCG